MRTADLGLAAALVTLGYELKDMDMENPRRIYFIFDENNDKAKDDAGAFYQSKLRIDPLKFFNNVKMLKSRIHSATSRVYGAQDR